MVKGQGMDTGMIFMLITMVVVGLFLFSQFTDEIDCTAANVADDNAHGSTSPSDTYRGISIPESQQLDETTLMVMKIMMVGIFVFAAYAGVSKFAGKPMSRKDAFTLILIGLALFFLWDNILMPVFNAATIQDITLSVGQKLGLI